MSDRHGFTLTELILAAALLALGVALVAAAAKHFWPH
ncbi:MAG: prepilin-type N-terminal cleavage/methylation domain-containing protein [Armatimonadia bacterium]